MGGWEGALQQQLERFGSDLRPSIELDNIHAPRTDELSEAAKDANNQFKFKLGAKNEQVECRGY